MQNRPSFLRRLFFKKRSHAKRYKRKIRIIFYLLFPGFLPPLWQIIQIDNAEKHGSIWILILYFIGIVIYVWWTEDQYHLIEAIEKSGPLEGYTRAQLRAVLKEMRTGKQKFQPAPAIDEKQTDVTQTGQQ